MDVLDTRDELVGQEKDSLQGELSVAEIEKILQTGTEKVEDHGVIVTLSTKPANEWNTHAAGQRLVDTGLVFQLRVLGLDGLELDSDFLAGDYVGTEVDVTERARTDLSADTVLVTNAKILFVMISKLYMLILCLNSSLGTTKTKQQRRLSFRHNMCP